jgi:hypothetical protein
MNDYDHLLQTLIKYCDRAVDDGDYEEEEDE